LKKKNNNPYIVTRTQDCQIRLIDTSDALEKNKYYDSISMTEAFNIAKAANIDLVCFENATRDKLAFCKVMDFGKWKYDTAKKKKKQQKESKKVTKEIRFSPVISDHDIEHKVKQANKFLNEGDDVLLTMRLKGRQRIYAKEAQSKLVEVANMCEDISIINTKFDSGNYFYVRIVRKVGKKD